jgi:hypothetical protein
VFDDEEVLGEPRFELRLKDGEPQVSGCYFMHPVLLAEHVEWDEHHPHRILVTASDGSRWYADDVTRTGVVSALLHRAER